MSVGSNCYKSRLSLSIQVCWHPGHANAMKENPDESDPQNCFSDLFGSIWDITNIITMFNVKSCSHTAAGQSWKRSALLLLPLYLTNLQYHSTHVCHNLTLLAGPVPPKRCTWQPLFVVHSLADSRCLSRCGETSTVVFLTHTQSESREGLLLPGLSSNQQTLSVELHGIQIPSKPRASYSTPAKVDSFITQTP